MAPPKTPGSPLSPWAAAQARQLLLRELMAERFPTHQSVAVEAGLRPPPRRPGPVDSRWRVAMRRRVLLGRA